MYISKYVKSIRIETPPEIDNIDVSYCNATLIYGTAPATPTLADLHVLHASRRQSPYPYQFNCKLYKDPALTPSYNPYIILTVTNYFGDYDSNWATAPIHVYFRTGLKNLGGTPITTGAFTVKSCVDICNQNGVSIPIDSKRVVA